MYWTPADYPRQAAYAHAVGTIWLRRDLTDAEARSLLAHELGHHHHGDHGPQSTAAEARAWRWAARKLLPGCVYPLAERDYGPSVPALAEALNVTAEVIEAYRTILMRTT